MKRHLRASVVGIVALTFPCSLPAQTDWSSINGIRAFDVVTSAPGGIAGVGYSEDFESGVTPCCNLQLINHSDPAFGNYSLLDRASGTSQGLQNFRSPIFALQTGGTFADIIINNTTSLFQFITVNTTTGFFNTRVNFDADGVIRALQILGQPPCSTGTFATTAGTWTPGVKL